MTVIPNLIILSLPLSFLRNEGFHQNNIVSQHSDRELFSSTQDLRCKIKLIIFWFHAVIDHYDNGSKLDLDLPVTAPQSEFPYSSKYTNLIPEQYRAMIDSYITCSRIVRGILWKQKKLRFSEVLLASCEDYFFVTAKPKREFSLELLHEHDLSVRGKWI